MSGVTVYLLSRRYEFEGVGFVGVSDDYVVSGGGPIGGAPYMQTVLDKNDISAGFHYFLVVSIEGSNGTYNGTPQNVDLVKFSSDNNTGDSHHGFLL